MKILFIRPKPSAETIGLQHLMVVEPLELEILAALVSDRHECRIVDMILEKSPVGIFIESFHPDVLCLTGYITHIPAIIDCCIIAKSISRSIITVTGGVHTELFPEDIDHESIDYRVVRNATSSFSALINYIEKGSDFPAGVLRVNEKPDGKLLPPYKFYSPHPCRELTGKYRKKYFYVFHNRVALLKTSFGCPYKCSFCFCRKITGDNYHVRSLEDVIEELRSVKEKEIYIVDDDFLLNEARLREFIALLGKFQMRKRFLVYGRADFIARNPALMRDFREAGLRTVIVGLESFDDGELKGFHKLTNSSTNRKAMEVLNTFRINCYAAVIISPSWREEDFRRAGDIMTELGIRYVNLQPLTPLKGTGLDYKEDDLIIWREDYVKWDLAHVSIRPENMSIKDFYTSILKLYERIILNPRNIAGFLKYPLGSQIKMIKGIVRVRKQYRSIIMASAE